METTSPTSGYFKKRFDMLFGIVLGFVWTFSLSAGLIVLVRKFCDANPEIKDAAKKAATNRATQLVDRI